MKYIDGIKNNEMSLTYFGEIFNGAMMSFGKLQQSIKPIKHIPILVPITNDDILDLTKDYSDVKWIDGQPYEVIIINNKRRTI